MSLKEETSCQQTEARHDSTNEVSPPNPKLKTKPGLSFVLADDDDGAWVGSLNKQYSTDSISDGIDIVGGPQRPDTFAEFNTTWTGRIVNHLVFKRSVVALIIINGILMGIATFPFIRENATLDMIFDRIDDVFLILFSAEIFLRILHFRQRFLTNAWLLTDFVIVAASWLCNVVLVLRTFRIFRTLRLATRIKPFRRLIVTMGKAVPRLAAVACIMLISLCTFSILFTHMFQNEARQEEDGSITSGEFADLAVSLFTLFQVTTLDGWSTIARDFAEENDWAWLPFVGYLIVSFMILSLFLAIFMDTTLQTRREKHLNKREELTAETNRYMMHPKSSIHRMEQKLQDMTMTIDRMVQEQTKLMASGRHRFVGMRNQEEASSDGSEVDSTDLAKYDVDLKIR